MRPRTRVRFPPPPSFLESAGSSRVEGTDRLAVGAERRFDCSDAVDAAPALPPQGKLRRIVSRRVVLLPPGDPDPRETARRDVELLGAWEPGVVGVAGWSEAGWEALGLAAEHPEVERLVLLATPVHDGAAVPEIGAKTLLLYGTEDERTGSSAARWWKRQIPHARFEMCSGQGHDLLLAMWPRVLSHLAPGMLR